MARRVALPEAYEQRRRLFLSNLNRVYSLLLGRVMCFDG
jgi:hypothetical protein